MAKATRIREKLEIRVEEITCKRKPFLFFVVSSRISY